MSETPHSAARDPRIQPVLERLLARYGRARRGKRDPLEVLIRGVLSQNTSDVNSARAYENLVARFGTWEAVAAAPRAAIEGAIRQGGLAAQKARTIKAILERLGERGAYCLEHLRHAPVEEAERELKAVKGVGIKTARLVLLFGFGRPVFVVDTHVHRVARRLGWVPEGCTRDKAHVLLDERVPDAQKYSAHIAMIRHGRELCRPRAPLCDRCPVSAWCLFAAART